MADESTLSGSQDPRVKPYTFAPKINGAYPSGTPVRSDGTAGEVTQTAGDTAAHARFLGLMIQSTDSAGEHALVQFAGIVELPTAAWDAIAGTSGGLVPNTPYFLSNTLGKLANAAGTVPVQVGIAISPTGLLLQVEKSPSVNP